MEAYHEETAGAAKVAWEAAWAAAEAAGAAKLIEVVHEA